MLRVAQQNIEPNAPATYTLRLQGHLGQPWQDWFDGAEIKLTDEGETVLTCSVVDQAALHGLLKKVRDLGMPLISVVRVDVIDPIDQWKSMEINGDNP